MSARFIEFQAVTLIGTWWGIIGCLIGPVFVLQNLMEYLSASFLIGRDFVKLRQQNAPDLRQSESRHSASDTIPNAPVVRSAEALLNLFKTADASTLIFSEGRRWLDQFLSDAREAKAPDTLRAEAAAILEYVGASRSGEFRAEQYRRFIHRFEAYLLENTAPSRELARVFLQYRNWLKKAYETVDCSNIQINDDVRDWYSRILSIRSGHPVIVPDRPTSSLA